MFAIRRFGDEGEGAGDEAERAEHLVALRDKAQGKAKRRKRQRETDEKEAASAASAAAVAAAKAAAAGTAAPAAGQTGSSSSKAAEAAAKAAAKLERKKKRNKDKKKKKRDQRGKTGQAAAGGEGSDDEDDDDASDSQKPSAKRGRMGAAEDPTEATSSNASGAAAEEAVAAPTSAGVSLAGIGAALTMAAGGATTGAQQRAAEGVPGIASGAAAAASRAAAAVKNAARARQETEQQLGGGSLAAAGATTAIDHSIDRPGSLKTVAESWGLDARLVAALAAAAPGTSTSTSSAPDSSLDRFFPVQRAVIPALLAADASEDPTLADVCVSAPTGSGKTLAYALPMLHHVARLRAADGPRLRAVVLLPTRDLVAQVGRTLTPLGRAVGVDVLTATGQTGFREQRRRLALAAGRDALPRSAERWWQEASTDSLVQPGQDPSIADVIQAARVGAQTAAAGPLAAAGPAATRPVDVLVCTPGRLADLLSGTDDGEDGTQSDGLRLDALCYLVLDEADRLLAQSYHGTVALLDQALRASSEAAAEAAVAAAATTSVTAATAGAPARTLVHSTRIVRAVPGASESAASGHGITHPSLAVEALALSTGRAALASLGADPARRPSWASALASGAPQTDGPAAALADGAEDHSYGVLPAAAAWRSTLPGYPALRRVLVSATLAANPQRVAALRLRRPRLFVTRQDVSELPSGAEAASTNTASSSSASGSTTSAAVGAMPLPSSLSQRMLATTAASKPAALLWLLQGLMARRVQTLVFAASVEAVHAITRTIALFDRMPGGAAPMEFSAAMPQGRRARVLRSAAKGFDACPIIVASDAAARGVDLPCLGAVVQYDAPSSLKAYVHRAGRAARAGRAGECISIVRPAQRRWLAAALRRAGIAEDMVRCPRACTSQYTARLGACMRALPRLLQAEAAGALDAHDAPPALEDLIVASAKPKADASKDGDAIPDAPREQVQPAEPKEDDAEEAEEEEEEDADGASAAGEEAAAPAGEAPAAAAAAAAAPASSSSSSSDSDSSDSDSD